ncbi:MAG: tetratricopeptide repeat protein, partial [Myxococcota bacterium]
MANKAKLINMAQKAMAKGQWDKAVSFLEKILAEEPGDVRTMLRLGDVCAKKGDRPRAVDVYRRVATHHAEQGFFLKAVAVYKQILKLDPTNGEAALRIAELHEQLGLAQDAMVHFQLALPVLEEQGQHDQVVEVLARILELDGENVAARIKLAETLSRLDRRGDAVEHFAQAARILKQQARIEDYVKVAERLIFHDSSRLDLVKDLAKLYLSRGDTKRGLAKLQICFRETPRDVETLTLLAKAFDDLGQVLKTVYVYRELARVHAEEGRADEAREIHRLILQHVPDEAESLRALGLDAPSAPSPRSPRSSLEFEAPVDLAAHSGDVNMTGALPINASRDLREPTVEPPIETPFLGETSPTPSLHDEPTDAGPRSRYPELATGDLLVDAELQGSSLPPPPEQSPLSDEMEQIISEAEVYISYNLPSRAIEHLRRALALDPASPPVYRRLHDAYAAMGDSDRAAEAMANVLTLYLNAGDSSRADEARLALQALDPQHPTLHGAQPRQADQFAAGVEIESENVGHGLRRSIRVTHG